MTATMINGRNLQGVCLCCFAAANERHASTCDFATLFPAQTASTPGGFVRAADHAESDPNGKNASEPGAKLDAGKNRLGLVLGGFALALEQVGEVGTFGAEKYTPNGWITVPNGVERYTDAMYRHLMIEAQGELIDPQTKLFHAAHTAWNALARLDLMIRKWDAQ